MSTKDATAESGENPDRVEVRQYSEDAIKAPRNWVKGNAENRRFWPITPKNGASPSEGEAVLDWMDRQGNPITHQRIIDFRAGFRAAELAAQELPNACPKCGGHGAVKQREAYARSPSTVPCDLCASAPSSEASATTTAAEASGNNA